MNGLDTRASGLERCFTGEPGRGPDGFHRVALSLRKEGGQRIRCLLTTPGDEWRGVIVVLSGLGRTMRHSNAMALAAAHHGYATVRFDPSDHVGDSDGGIIDAVMSGIADDLLFVCNAVRKAGWSDRLFVVAASTFARCAIRSTRHGLPADGMILTLPVVHFEKTLAVVTGEELLAAYRERKFQRTDPVPILSHQIRARFLEDAIEHGYCDLETTRAELRQADMPLAMIVAEGDDWVSVDDVVAALEPDGPSRKLYVLENADHDSYSFGFIRAITQTTIQALAEMTGDEVGDVYEVTFSKFSSAVKTEKKILSRAREVWSDHD